MPERGALPTASIVLTVTYNVGIQHVYTPSARTHRERTSGRQMSALYVLTIPGKLQIHTDNARFEPRTESRSAVSDTTHKYNHLVFRDHFRIEVA